MSSGYRLSGRSHSGSANVLASVFVILVSLLLSLRAPLRAQATAAGSSRLEGVEVVGSARFHSDQIAPATGLHNGTNVTRDDLQAGADRLAKLGPFTGVQYRFTTVEGGVKVTYQVADAAAVPVSFDNFPWFTDEEITAAIKNAIVLFDGSAPAKGTILDDISTALAKLLETHNPHAAVSHSLVTSASGQQVQQFQMDGAALKVGSVEFSDALANGDRGIQTRLSDIVGKPFSRSALETFELEQVRPIYLSRGFLRVQFDRANARFAGSAESSLPNKLVVVAPVQPGPAYVWNGLTWMGNSAIPPHDLDQFAKLKTGDPADGMKIEAMWQEVRDAYSKRGFLDATLNPVPQFDENAKRVTYAVSIMEGPQYQMGNLILTGLSPDGEKRIRTAWKIASGSVFDKTFYDQFLDTGIKQAFVGLTYHYDKIGRFLQQDPKTAKVDVLLDFQ
jgi:outer membrane protein assembly factor BamA